MAADKASTSRSPLIRQAIGQFSAPPWPRYRSSSHSSRCPADAGATSAVICPPSSLHREQACRAVSQLLLVDLADARIRERLDHLEPVGELVAGQPPCR